MNLLSLPLLEAFVLLAKMTVIFCWGVVMLGFAIRVILKSVMDEIYGNEEQKEK